jgi:hypothetical protein
MIKIFKQNKKKGPFVPSVPGRPIGAEPMSFLKEEMMSIEQEAQVLAAYSFRTPEKIAGELAEIRKGIAELKKEVLIIKRRVGV